MTEITREHPEFRRRQPLWRTYRDLYAGGQQFKDRAAHYLAKRQKEGLDIYGERLQRVFYHNYVGSIVDWYSSTLFRRQPSLQLYGGLAAGRDFMAAFTDNVDLRGTSLSTFFRNCFADALIAGRSHILVDFPAASREAATRAEEDLMGASRGFLVRYQAEELINWSRNEFGEYDWVVLRHQSEFQPDVDSRQTVSETTWRYYDRQSYRVYRQSIVEGKSGSIELVSSGRHALAKQ